MTSPQSDVPSRRAEDMGRAGRMRAFYLRWKDPVFAVILPPTAIATVVIGLQVRSFSEDRASDAKIVRVLAQEQAKNARATQEAARQSCLRTRAFAPGVADDYERRGVFPPAVLDKYRATIPKSCPQ